MPEAADRRAPLGIFGGTFDPVHVGHLRLAEEAREALGLAGVRWIPAGQPPHRGAPRAAPAHRLAMVRLAVADNPAFAVDAGEVDAGTPSYTVATLERLRASLGWTRPLVLLLGADAFAGLESWHRWPALFELAHLAVLHRPGYGLADLPETLAAQACSRRAECAAQLADRPAGLILALPMTPLAISASDLRARLAAGRSVRYLLPGAVVDYIARHHLYDSLPSP
jgi:nicotinate-nucleotide adenylyltransferase